MTNLNAEKLYPAPPRIGVRQGYSAEPAPLSPLAKFATITAAAALSWLVTLGIAYMAYKVVTGF